MGCGASSHPADDAAAAEPDNAPKAAAAEPDSAPKAAAAEPVTAAPAGENQLAIGQESNQDLSAPQNPQVSELFKQIDANGSGTISRSEVIKICRKDEQVRMLLGLPAKIDDSSRDALEAVFQGMDADHSKDVDEPEFQRWMGQVKAGNGSSYRPAIKAAAGGEQLAIEGS